MQTFLPYPSFEDSAKVLDNRRLGKQRVECLQILKALARTEWSCSSCGEPQTQYMSKHPTHYHNIILTPWYRHPAVQMWRGKEWNLCRYGIAMCDEWIHRGFKDTCANKILLLQIHWQDQITEVPYWLRKQELKEKICSSHRSNLLRKDSVWYGRFGWKESNDLPYFWPSKNNP